MYNKEKRRDFMTNKNIFATNLKRYMALNDKSRKDLANDLDISYYTVTDWVKGKKYPRMDKVEILANYFGILKSDLIEEKTQEHREMQQKNSTLADITVRMRTDNEFLSLIEGINQLNAEQQASVKQIVDVLLKG
jgi:transcriptional regulator with XRE-family HTH domain